MEHDIKYQSPARMVAGALAHLARHMETGCPRAGHLAAMLLDEVATDAEADPHLRAHARELGEILERDSLLHPVVSDADSRRQAAAPGKASGKASARA